MTYDFASLNHADFEDLARDIIGREIKVRFEAFAAGPDGGIDGRHASNGKEIILQAKHYLRSTFAKLKSTMKKERSAIDRLSPGRYLLATSRPLTPPNKKALALIIGGALQSEDDIFGPEDLNGLLRTHPTVVKAHIKLWLTSTEVLQLILRSATRTFTSITAAEIEAKLRVYAPNPSLDKARAILEDQHVAIISGPPGVGKTTLAEMLSYAYIAEGWELVAIRSLEDGFTEINDTKKQIFLFDDFLGRVALDRQALAHKDSDLARFLKRIRMSRNARFILTTRAYIFEEARRVSEYLADTRIDISKYVLDVGIYTRRIKARVIYNHLLISGVSHDHIVVLIKSGQLPKIVDHKNYNPRIIEWMTDVTRIDRIKPADYPSAFIAALNNPESLWDIAFRTHIPDMCRHLLFALFFSSRWVSQADLKSAFDSLHPRLSRKYGRPYDPKDFEESLRILEGGFINLRGQSVHFVNPSVDDYLSKYLNDLPLLKEIAAAARQTDWANAVWKHCEKLEPSPSELREFAMSFIDIAAEFGTLPVREKIFAGDHYEYTNIGLSNIARIELLLNWWTVSHDQRFANFALSLAKSPVDRLDVYREGSDAIDLLGQVRDGGYFPDLPCADELANGLEQATLEMLTYGLSLDELDKISDAADMLPLGARIRDTVMSMIHSEVDDIGNWIDQIDAESELNDNIETLKSLGLRASVPQEKVDAAVARIRDRINDLEEKTTVSSSPSFRSSSKETENFDDISLQNLFQPLLSRDDQ